ncbi:hypothetical protein [Catenovulum agarivorans]|uniref:hypothetical protein n=1 Tax=Catenovulum agarivorans TaxID=1172192 RepID=UPI0003678EA8|nr:hypothetical protein [Catenovulum agarivorans]
MSIVEKDRVYIPEGQWGIAHKNAAKPSMARSQTVSLPIEVLFTTRPFTFLNLAPLPIAAFSCAGIKIGELHYKQH